MLKDKKIVLITGAARRIGLQLAKTFHHQGYGVVIHYRNSAKDALALERSLNQLRPNSAVTVQADLAEDQAASYLIEQAIKSAGRLNVLINNASSFYSTPMGEATVTQWDELTSSNLKAPFFLAQAAFSELSERSGSIINIVDIHAERGLTAYPIYSAAKGGLATLTKALAKEMAPTVRINGIAPGAILWPEHQSDETQQKMVENIPLKRMGCPEDIAQTALFLAEKAPYITGQVISVDGGKSLI